MAKGNQTALSIVIRTVDQATAGIRAINARIAKVMLPVRSLGLKLQSLGRDAGLPKLAEGFKGVGSAAAQLATRIGAVAVAAGLSVAALKQAVDKGSMLAKTADNIGLSVDALAQLRFAAEQAGVAHDALDGALEELNIRLGEAKAGEGSLHSFLSQVSPALLKQMKAAKTTEDAFLLLSDAMVKLEDPTKKAALASAAFSDPGIKLITLLNQGSKGIKAAQQDYANLAGSQEGAARQSEKMNASMLRVSAAFAGVKAGILEGLAPAFIDLAERLGKFFAENREAITAWVKDFAEKLPGAVSSLMDGLDKLVDFIKPIWDAMGGISTAAAILAGVLGLKLVLAIKALSVAILTTPAGWIIGAIAAIALGAFMLVKHWDKVKAFFVYLWGVVRDAFMTFFNWVKGVFLKYTFVGAIVRHWEPITAFFGELWDSVTAVFQGAWDGIKFIVDQIMAVVDGVVGAVQKVTGAVRSVGEGVGSFLGITEDAGAPSAAGPGELAGRRLFGSPALDRLAAGGATRSEAAVKVEFANAPRGTRVTQGPRNTADVDLAVGYQMVTP
jgi:hypothetical protein